MKNCRPTAYGWQLYTKVRGEFISEHLTKTEDRREPPSAMQIRNWVQTQHAAIKNPHLLTPAAKLHGGFASDVEHRYLPAVTSMPSYVDREQHMREWARLFRDRPRDSVTALEIRTQLERLHETYSASSCNKRRTALMSFYTRLNGKTGYNPVRDVEKYAEEAEIRAQTPMTIYRVLSFMRPSKTRARLRVILWTGWPHAQIKRLKPEHLDLKKGRAYVTPRRKGKGRAGKWLPLLPQAVRALKEFEQWECYGPFSPSSMHGRFAEALGKLNAHRARLKLRPLDIHPYDIRHTFGTWLARHLTDERAIQELMLHSRAEQTRRYTEAATAGRVEAALNTLRNLQPLATKLAPRPSLTVQSDSTKSRQTVKN